MPNSTARWARCFNTQPPEGGWQRAADTGVYGNVSTHSRPKAAGKLNIGLKNKSLVSTHSRPKAAGSGTINGSHIKAVSTHSRPKAAG